MNDSDEGGATAVEYSLMVGLIAVVIASAVGFLGASLDGMFENFVLQMGWS